MAISEEHLKHYIDQVFVKYDTDHNQTLDEYQLYNFFKELFQSMGQDTRHLTMEDVKRSFKEINLKGDGRITKRELLQALKYMLGSPNQTNANLANQVKPKPSNDVYYSTPQPYDYGNTQGSNRQNQPRPFTPEYYSQQQQQKQTQQKQQQKLQQQQLLQQQQEKLRQKQKQTKQKSLNQLPAGYNNYNYPTNTGGDYNDIGRQIAGGMGGMGMGMGGMGGIGMGGMVGPSPMMMGSVGPMGMGMMGPGIGMGMMGTGGLGMGLLGMLGGGGMRMGFW